MNWSDETYVKLYRRDTLTWRSWPWQARALFPLIMRKVDGAGIIETGTLDPAAAVAMQVELPADVVRPGLEALLADGTVEKVPGGLIIPHFVDAQEATKTEARKKRDQRQRAADQRRHAQVAEIATSLVPQRPALSRDVPDCPPSAQLTTTTTTTTSSPPAHHQPSRTPPPATPKQIDLAPDVVPLPAKPPRPPRPVEVVHEYFLEAREMRLEELGLDPASLPDEPPDWPRSAATVSTWLKLSEFDDDERLALSFCKSVVDEYLASTYWAGAKKRVEGKDTDTPQPYPWSVLLNEKQWRGFLEAAERRLSGGTAGAA